MMLGVCEEVHFFHKTNMILMLGEYKMSNNFYLKVVTKELKMPSSLFASLNNVLVKAEAFQVSVGF